MTETWIPWARRDAAPAWKFSGFAPKSKTIYHSMSGVWAGARPRLFGSAQVSWPLSVLYGGELLQHYPLEANCWQSGDRDPVDGYMNRESVGVEFEGYHGGTLSDGTPLPWEPWTAPQFLTGVRLLKELRALGILEDFDRTLPGKTCYRHGEVVATACDGGRAPWGMLIASATAPPEEEEDDDMPASTFVTRSGPDKDKVYYVLGGRLRRVHSGDELGAFRKIGILAPVEDTVELAPGELATIKETFERYPYPNG